MKKLAIRISNDAISAFPRGADWAADVAGFAWDALVCLRKTRGSGAACIETLQRINSASEQEWFDLCYSPQLFSWLTDIESEPVLTDDHWRALDFELRADQHPVFLHDNTALPVWRRPIDRFLNRLRSIGQGSRSVSSAGAVFLDPHCELFQDSIRGLNAAVEMIREHAPGFFKDLLTFVRGIVLVDHLASFRGASGLNQCGLIFFSPDEEWSPLKWAEELVHESTHYIVHALDLRDHLVQGENALVEEHPGPFRPDLRHHHGNFHALCVIGRVTVFFDRLIEHGVESDLLREKRSDYLTRARPAYEAMLDSATFNPIGYALFRQIIAPIFGD